jgi:NAD(P)-dependent dehydrogenase (short-subunit alcohol dehydrogenase family)
MASVTSQDSSSIPAAGSTFGSESETAKPWAIVTGGSRGLGFETAKGLAAQGYRLLLVAKDPERLRRATEELNAYVKTLNETNNSNKIQTNNSSEIPTNNLDNIRANDSNDNSTKDPHRNLDVEDQIAHSWPIDFEATTPEALAGVQESARKILETYQSQWGLPKVVVIAHGVMSAKMSKTLRTDANEWRRVMSINLDSVFALVNVFGAAMSEARDGRIIIYSACLGRMSGPGNAGGLAPYRISKAGVNALVRNLAHETGHGARGFLIDAVCPNHSRTDMGGADAPRSAEEGAACAVWLATRPFTVGQDQTGLLWEDNEVIPW